MTILDYLNRGFTPYFMIDLEPVVDRENQVLYFQIEGNPATRFAFEIPKGVEECYYWGETVDMNYEEVEAHLLAHNYVCLGRSHCDVDLEVLFGLNGLTKLEQLMRHYPHSQELKIGTLVAEQNQFNLWASASLDYLDQDIQFTYQHLVDHLDHLTPGSGMVFALDETPTSEIVNGNYLFKLSYNPTNPTQFDVLFPN